MKTYQIITNSSCNLRCTYCYEYLDSRSNKLEDIIEYFETIVKPNKDNDTECVIDFIGGEPFFVPELIEGIIEYCEIHLPLWGYTKYIYSFSTNGTLLHKPKQEELIKKYKDKINLGISIDGDKEKHDKHRLTVGGKGSFDACMKGIETAIRYIKKCNLSIKATFTKDSISDYARSMKFLFNQFGNHVSLIQGNFNFEERFDVYDGSFIANEQFEVVRFIMSNDFHAEYLFVMNKHGDKRPILNRYPLMNIKPKPLTRNRCGSCSGNMVSIGYDKKIYGCNRFSTMKRDEVELGYLDNGQFIENTINDIKSKVTDAYKELPSWCQSCRFNQECSDCVAIAVDEGLSHHDYYRQNRMCGYTKATQLAKLYACLLRTQYKENTSDVASYSTHH